MRKSTRLYIWWCKIDFIACCVIENRKQKETCMRWQDTHVICTAFPSHCNNHKTQTPDTKEPVCRCCMWSSTLRQDLNSVGYNNTRQRGRPQARRGRVVHVVIRCQISQRSLTALGGTPPAKLDSCRYLGSTWGVVNRVRQVLACRSLCANKSSSLDGKL